MKAMIRNLFSEPLIQFLLLGAVIFTLSALSQGRQSNARLVLPSDAKRQFVERYRNEHGDVPGAVIVQGFEQNWIKEEILFQEGLAMGVDQQDPVIRDRVIKKMQLLFAGQLTLETPDDDELRQFMLQHQERYMDAPRYRFLALSASASPQQDQLLLQALNNGADPAVLELPVQQVIDKNEAYLVATWGRDLVALLKERVADGRWQRVEVGGQALLLNYQAHQGQSLPDFAELKSRLVADWRKQQRLQKVDQQVAMLQQKYDVVWSE